MIKKYLPEWDKDGRIILDYALIIRTPNPLRTKELNRIVYIFAGIHKPGTLGAAYFTQDRYASMINEAVARMKSFVVLAEIQVDYLGTKSLDPIITPKSIVRVYDLPYKYSGSLGIAVIFPCVGAKNSFLRVMPPYVGGITATPNEAIFAAFLIAVPSNLINS